MVMKQKNQFFSHRCLHASRSIYGLDFGSYEEIIRNKIKNYHLNNFDSMRKHSNASQ